MIRAEAAEQRVSTRAAIDDIVGIAGDDHIGEVRSGDGKARIGSEWIDELSGTADIQHDARRAGGQRVDAGQIDILYGQMAEVMGHIVRSHDIQRAFAADGQTIGLLGGQGQGMTGGDFHGTGARIIDGDFGQIDIASKDQIGSAHVQRQGAGMEGHVIRDRQHTACGCVGEVKDPLAVCRQRRSETIGRAQGRGGDTAAAGEGEGRQQAVVGRSQRSAVVIGAINHGDGAQIERPVIMGGIDHRQGITGDSGIGSERAAGITTERDRAVCHVAIFNVQLFGAVQQQCRTGARCRQGGGEAGGIENQRRDIDIGGIDRGDVDVVVT